ncbi:hypothetical protein L210DRAFT_3413442 [Boletus edulis BED1]|uniref:PROP1-like PPR domain-containing protein n=1 Tax=Boletus edulis BED1 TaxID=1328754 RepID=A0AAD4BJU8_BOLED|nr:hypothetical protein L210DRAFT_3413442 [Boletus edulis BED1]
MLPKVANHLFLQTSRAVALVQNQSGALRNVLQSGPAAGAGPSWSSTGTGAGPGGAKFHAGSKFYKGYTGAGRALTQANPSATQDGVTKADDDKEDIKASFVTPRHSSRTLARRHSFSLNDRDHLGAGVLHTVQLQLRERHTAAANKDHQDESTPDQEPRPLTAWSPFSLALENALSNKNTPTVLQHVRWLIDPSSESSLSFAEPTLLDFNQAIRALVSIGTASSAALIPQLYNALLQRGLSPNLGTLVNTIIGLTDRDREVQRALDVLSYRAKRRQLTAIGDLDNLADEEAQLDSNHNATLLSEDNFAIAMRVFDAACTSDAAKATKPLAFHFPINVYHGLLRSCAAHANIDAAIRVYAQLEARSQPPPTDLMFYYLLSTYVNAGDLTGAKEVFKEFRDLGARGSVIEVERQFPIKLRIWNKMIQGYFKAGQPAGALRLLETMMDSGKPEKGDLASIPSPASSTFTTIISGFCNPASDVAQNPPKPDIKTALSWFDRLLQQPTASSHSDQPTQNPSRPDQLCWSIILDALVETSSEQTPYLEELNRLYDILVDCAPKDRLGVKISDSLMVLEANLRVLDEFAKAGQSMTATKEAEEATHTANYIGKHLRQVADQLVSVKPGKNLAKYKATVTKILSGYLNTVAVTHSSTHPLEPMLPTLPLVACLGSPTAPSIARPLLHTYMSAPQVLASASDLETVLLSALSLPVNSNVESSIAGQYTGLMSLLQAMSDVGVDLRLVSSKVQVALTDALYSKHGEREVARFLDGLGWSFNRLRMPLAERMDGEDSVPRTPTPPPPSAGFPPSPSQITIDSELSRQIDQWFPSHPSVTVNDSFNTVQAAISGTSPRYPHPATLGRLINGLGRVGNIAAAQSVYSIAQQVLFSPFVAQSPTWQSQAWFQIEDNMIIAYAHGGDMDAAFAHRNRITATGGVPSPDAYGSLIECVKDTTDDTSNAMALFTESQMLGTKPNVYLYNTIISKLAKARKADFALELFQQMKTNTSLRPSSITYGAVIAACARVGDAAAAERLFAEMTSQHNFKPRIPPYNTMMQLYTHTKPDRSKVLFYLNKMTEANVQPSAHTHKLLIDAYGTIEPVDVAAMEATFKRVESNPHVRLQGSHWAALINAYGCVMKDTDKAISVFDSITSHPSSQRGPTPLPDAVSYESLINVLVTRKRMDLAQQYLARLQASGVHMTAYIANLLIKGYAADGGIEQARAIFESLADPASGVAAPGNHVPHESSSAPSTPPMSPDSVSYREPSTWEAMFRAELGNGDRDRAVALLERLKQRHFPEAVYNRIRGIMLDDAVAPWGQSSSSSQPESPTPSSSP